MSMWVRAGGALVAGGVFMLLLSAPGFSASQIVLVSDLGQLLAAAVASYACLRTSHHALGRQRRAWAFMAAGTGSWAVGQLVWTYYEVALGVAVPFPSLADLGFLLFPSFAAAGLLSWFAAPERVAARWCGLLDGAIVACSLLALSWTTTLGTVVAVGGESWLAAVLSLAYPLGDVILTTIVLLLLTRVGPGRRSPLLLVVGGVLGLAVSDSAYVYLVAVGSYSSGDLVTSGWVFGFLLVAAAASHSAAERRARPAEEAASAAKVPSRLWTLVPYAPTLPAVAMLCFRLVTEPGTPLVELGFWFALVTLVLTRQYLAMGENWALLRELEVVRDQLSHRALHDPLTGLANRVLFADRLEHALTQRGADISVLYCDLDDFKRVNDQLGHEAGDEVLRTVSQRLLESVRPCDTVARLGGDEFAILLEGSEVATQVADRIMAAVARPCPVGDGFAHTSTSVGIAHHHRIGEGAARNHLRVMQAPVLDGGAAILRRADAAMYAAKAAGKAQAVDTEQPPGSACPVIDPRAVATGASRNLQV